MFFLVPQGFISLAQYTLNKYSFLSNYVKLILGTIYISLFSLNLLIQSEDSRVANS